MNDNIIAASLIFAFVSLIVVVIWTEHSLLDKKIALCEKQPNACMVNVLEN